MNKTERQELWSSNWFNHDNQRLNWIYYSHHHGSVIMRFLYMCNTEFITEFKYCSKALSVIISFGHIFLWNRNNNKMAIYNYMVHVIWICANAKDLSNELRTCWLKCKLQREKRTWTTYSKSNILKRNNFSNWS